MGLSEKEIPETYFCELCLPRSLRYTKTQAAAIQEKKLSEEQEAKRSEKRKSGSKKLQKSTTPVPKKGRVIFFNVLFFTYLYFFLKFVLEFVIKALFFNLSCKAM